jgi:uncharacterized protein
LIQLSSHEVVVLKSLAGALLKNLILFGSRVTKTARADSDLDICIKGIPHDLGEVGELRERLHQSTLPFVVDIVHYNLLPTAFQEKIDQQGVWLKDI